MGDRANVKVIYERGTRPPSAEGCLPTTEESSVFLYTHWGGHELPIAVYGALYMGARWDDPAYLARIVFDFMKGEETIGTTGFGIAPYMPDNEHPIIVLDCPNQQISLVSENQESMYGPVQFADFVNDPTELFVSYFSVHDAEAGRAMAMDILKKMKTPSS